MPPGKQIKINKRLDSFRNVSAFTVLCYFHLTFFRTFFSLFLVFLMCRVQVPRTLRPALYAILSTISDQNDYFP